MIQCKVLKQLENLDQQKYDDEDITDDIKFLLERLGESVQDLRYYSFSLSLYFNICFVARIMYTCISAFTELFKQVKLYRSLWR